MVNLLNFVIELISVMFVGHVSELALSGISMATSFSSVTGIDGNGKYLGYLLWPIIWTRTAWHVRRTRSESHACSYHLMRTISIIWANTKSILILFSQDHKISTEVGRYAQLIIPYLFASSVLQCQTRFLQTQNIGVSMILSSGVATALHAALC
ncbi:hypothetical protein Ahy_B04g069163 [Arachis hypogaea]|uniref:Protein DETOXIFICATION n=1 Tax=Arachis hypogaea TaxID=3818 RepID=A0A444ZBU3_ARAHY|nr:hypothetical protein Ahy_B04g069163 [Arachis hypogaea]